MLPTSIFENTPEGMTEHDKQELLITGKSEYWEIAGESPDVLVFTTLPFRDSSIGMRLFRNSQDSSVEVAIGTLGEPVCSVELWRLDSSGRLVPVDTPAEPDVREFFVPGHALSPRIQHSVLICLGDGGLSARPVFWNNRGILPAQIDNNIDYVWTGQNFKKKISAAKNSQPQ